MRDVRGQMGIHLRISPVTNAFPTIRALGMKEIVALAFPIVHGKNYASITPARIHVRDGTNLDPIQTKHLTRCQAPPEFCRESMYVGGENVEVGTKRRTYFSERS